MLGGVGAAAGGELVEVGEGQHVLEAGELAAHAVDLRRAARRPRRARRSTRSGRGCSGSPRGPVRVDRRRDRPDRAEREVEEAPLDRVSAEDREGVALAARRARAGRSRSSSTRSAASAQRDRRQASPSCDEVGGSLAAGGDRVAPEPLDRALAHASHLMLQGSSRVGRIVPVPYTCRSTCARPGTVRSASDSSRSPWASPRRRSLLRARPTSRSGCCTASAGRRSSRSAGAPCTSGRSARTRSSRAGRSPRASS